VAKKERDPIIESPSAAGALGKVFSKDAKNRAFDQLKTRFVVAPPLSWKMPPLLPIFPAETLLDVEHSGLYEISGLGLPPQLSQPKFPGCVPL